MANIQWNNHFNIGIDEIDKAHKRLFQTICKLIKLNEDTAYSRQGLQEEIKIFKNYTIKYFSSEELYMKYSNYNRYVRHKRLHDDLREKIMPSLEKEMQDSDYSVESIQHFLGTCMGWLIGHILIESRAITGQITNIGKYEQGDYATDTLEKIVIQVLQELFQIESQIISRHYNVEDFENGVYYHLIYVSKNNSVFHVFLAFEEQFLLRVFDDPAKQTLNKIDETLIYTLKQLSRHLVKRIGVYFKSEGIHNFCSEDIITHKQLAEQFEKEYPPYSLLFDTENGHFAICIYNNENFDTLNL